MVTTRALLRAANFRKKTRPVRDDVKARFLSLPNPHPEGEQLPEDYRKPRSERVLNYVPFALPGTDTRVEYRLFEECRTNTVFEREGAKAATHAALLCVKDGYIFDSNGTICTERDEAFAMGKWSNQKQTNVRVPMDKSIPLRDSVDGRQPLLFSLVEEGSSTFANAICHAVPKVLYFEKWLRENRGVKILYASEIQRWAVSQFAQFHKSRWVRFERSVGADKMFWPFFIREGKTGPEYFPWMIRKPLRYPGTVANTLFYAIRESCRKERVVENEVDVVYVLRKYAEKNGLRFEIFREEEPSNDRTLMQSCKLFCGPTGGALANCAFMNESAVLLELKIGNVPDNRSHLYQNQMYFMGNLNYYSCGPVPGKPSVVDVGQLKDTLEQIDRSHIHELDLESVVLPPDVVEKVLEE